MKSPIALMTRLHILLAADNVFAAEPKPMRDEGLPPPSRLGAKPTTYAPSPCQPPRRGSKRKRQWR